MMLHYKAGYRYIVHETIAFITPIRTGEDIITQYVALNGAGVLAISKGFAWDGASGPTIDTRNSMRASLAHDALYALIRLEKLDHKWKAMIDKLFYDLLLEDGMCRVRATIWYWAVSRFAEPATKPSAERPVLVAP